MIHSLKACLLVDDSLIDKDIEPKHLREKTLEILEERSNEVNFIFHETKLVEGELHSTHNRSSHVPREYVPGDNDISLDEDRYRIYKTIELNNSLVRGKDQSERDRDKLILEEMDDFRGSITKVGPNHSPRKSTESFNLNTLREILENKSLELR